MNKLRWLTLMLCLVSSSVLRGQSVPYYQSHFPPEEFKAHWEKIFEQIGDRALSIVQGSPQVGGYIFPRQGNDFYGGRMEITQVEPRRRRASDAESTAPMPKSSASEASTKNLPPGKTSE